MGSIFYITTDDAAYLSPFYFDIIYRDIDNKIVLQSRAKSDSVPTGRYIFTLPNNTESELYQVIWQKAKDEKGQSIYVKMGQFDENGIFQMSGGGGSGPSATYWIDYL